MCLLLWLAYAAAKRGESGPTCTVWYMWGAAYELGSLVGRMFWLMSAGARYTV